MSQNEVAFIFQVLLNYLVVQGFHTEEYKVISSWPRRDVSMTYVLVPDEIKLLIFNNFVCLICLISYVVKLELQNSFRLDHEL